MNTIIRKEDVHFPQKRQRDDVGRVFEWDDRVFRAIFPDQEAHVHALFSTGLLNELISKEYIPNTWLTDYKMDGYGLILEHQRIWPVVYPQEWTFSMLQDAALRVYSIGTIARRYGFNMKDCHGLNVLYDGVTAKFSDLGSLVPTESTGWAPYEEFLRFYYYPLFIWQFNSFVGKLSVFSGNLTTHENYLDYRYPFFRSLSSNMRRRIVDLCVRPPISTQTQLLDVPQIAPGNKRKLPVKTWAGKIVGKMLPIDRPEPAKVIYEIQRMKRANAASPWATYHEDIREKANRFDRIIEILKNLDDSIKSAVDLGGNQGKFSRLLIESTDVKRVVCIDADENAIDAGYAIEKSTKTERLTFAHFDFMGSIAKLRFTLPADRFRADAAFVLALSHHLLLAQGYDIDEMFRNIASYARKYVFIEFMPLGLWSAGQEPKVPEWYTQDWFRSAFVGTFDLLHEEKLRENNVLFVGRVRVDS